MSNFVDTLPVFRLAVLCGVWHCCVSNRPGGMFVLGWVLCSELVLIQLLGPQQHHIRPADELGTSARAPRKGCDAFSSTRSPLPGPQSDRSLTCTMASRHDMLGNEPAASYSRSYLPDGFGLARGYRGGDRWVVSRQYVEQSSISCSSGIRGISSMHKLSRCSY